MKPDIAFTPLTHKHLPLLHDWLQLPHVREFWDDGDRTYEQVEKHYLRDGRDVLAFIFLLDGEPVGYIQAYPIDAGSEFAAWRSETGDTSGIDLFIGEPGWLGRGQATRIIGAFVQRLQNENPNLRRILIDPETCNARARHVYAKTGFKLLATVELEGKEFALMASDLFH